MMRAALLLVLAGHACSYTLPSISHYDLVGPTRWVATSSASKPVILTVQRFDASSAFQGDGIALRTSPVRLEHYRYRRWVAPLPDQVTDLMARQWSASGRFGRVDLEELAPDADLLVDGRILAFEERAAPGHAPRAHVALELTARSIEGAPVYRKSLAQEVRMKGRSVESLVEALRTAVTIVAKESAPWLEGEGLRARKVRAGDATR